MDIKIMWAALVFGEHNIEPENWKPIKDSLRGTTIISLLFWILLFSTVFVSEDTCIVLDAFTENTAYVTDAAAIESFNEESSADKVLDVLEIVGGGNVFRVGFICYCSSCTASLWRRLV